MDEISRQFAEDDEQVMSLWQSAQQPSRQAAFQMRKGIGPIDLISGVWIERVGCCQHRQGMQIVGHHLGPEILLGRQPGQAGSVL